MTIVVIGAGAIGLLCAGRLGLAGQPIALLARPGSAAALAQQQIAITQNGQSQPTTGIKVVGNPDELRGVAPPELAVLCVKGYDTAGALPALEALAARQMLTLQNGIGNEELLIAHFGAPRILSGAITTSVEVNGPGQVAVAKRGGIGIAPVAGQPEARRWAKVFRSAGFTTRLYADYRAMKWSKALLNILGNATAAILDLPVEAVYADRRLVALERRAFLEALSVMDRLGLRPVNLPRYPAALLAAAMRYGPPALLDPLLRRLIAGGRGAKPPSLLLDLAHGSQRSEGEFLYGAIARTAQEMGINAPINHALWETLQGIMQGRLAWDSLRGRPDALLGIVGDR